MDILKEDYDISTTVEESINRMRCYLEVFSLAYITTRDGTKIRPCFGYGIIGDTVSSWDWAEERPTIQDIQNWKWAMNLLVDATNKLHNPLGKWISCPHHIWKWFYSISDSMLWKKDNGIH